MKRHPKRVDGEFGSPPLPRGELAGGQLIPPFGLAQGRPSLPFVRGGICHTPSRIGAGAARPCIQVIGLGNPDRGDDGVGPLVADLVRRQLPPSIRVTQLSGDLLSLMDSWRDADAAILVDAIYSGGTAGTVHRFDLRECNLPTKFFSSSTHTMNLAQVIELARA